MIDATQDIQTLTTFHENSAELIAQLKPTHRPMTLTVVRLKLSFKTLRRTNVCLTWRR